MELHEDDHPADEFLEMTGKTPPQYATGYVTWDPKVKPVTQVLPGKAEATFGQKKEIFNNPGVKLPDLKKAPLIEAKMKDGDNIVKVTDARARRQLYEVTMTGKIRRGVAGGVPEEFDTESIKSKFLNEAGAFEMGETSEDSERFQKLAETWVVKSLIWVAAVEKGRIGVTFYSDVGRFGKFHHSSFTSGGPLLAAGEWIVEKGELKKISGNSGHYRPTINELHRAVLFMAPAWTADTEVLLYNKKEHNWEYVPVNVFKGDPSGGGKYVAHASAA